MTARFVLIIFLFLTYRTWSTHATVPLEFAWPLAWLQNYCKRPLNISFNKYSARGWVKWQSKNRYREVLQWRIFLVPRLVPNLCFLMILTVLVLTLLKFNLHLSFWGKSSHKVILVFVFFFFYLVTHFLLVLKYEYNKSLDCVLVETKDVHLLPWPSLPEITFF